MVPWQIALTVYYSKMDVCIQHCCENIASMSYLAISTGTDKPCTAHFSSIKPTESISVLDFNFNVTANNGGFAVIFAHGWFGTSIVPFTKWELLLYLNLNDNWEPDMNLFSLVCPQKQSERYNLIKALQVSEECTKC